MRRRSGSGAKTIMKSRRFFQTSKIFGSVGLLSLVGGCTGGAVEKSKPGSTVAALATSASTQTRTGVQPSDSPMNSDVPIDYSIAYPTPSVLPPFGHDEGCEAPGYSYWDKHCQTAANSFCNGKTAPCGIVICNEGNYYSPLSDDIVDGHAFGWMIEGGSTCFYNWGRKECVKGSGVVPPKISSSDKLKEIVKKFCGDQYVEGNPIALEPGQSVPNRDATECLAVARRSSVQEYQFLECVLCCDSRADQWNYYLGKNPLEFDQKLKFLTACNNNCRILDPLATPPPRYTSLADRRGEQCGSQYGDGEGGGLVPEEQVTGCSGCCSLAAAHGDFPFSPAEIRACHAACMSKAIPGLGHAGGCCKVPFSDLTGKCPDGYYEYEAAIGTPGNFCLLMSCRQPATVGCAK
jgi:hypothetical protein